MNEQNKKHSLFFRNKTELIEEALQLLSLAAIYLNKIINEAYQIVIRYFEL